MGKKGSVKVVEFVPASSAANGELIAQATMSIHYVKNRKKDAFFYHIIR